MTGINPNNPGFSGANFNSNKSSQQKNDAAQAGSTGEQTSSTPTAGQQISPDRVMELMSQQAKFGNGITPAGLSIVQSVHAFERQFSPALLAALEEAVLNETSDFGLSAAGQDALVGETLGNLTAGTPNITV